MTPTWDPPRRPTTARRGARGLARTRQRHRRVAVWGRTATWCVRSFRRASYLERAASPLEQIYGHNHECASGAPTARGTDSGPWALWRHTVVQRGEPRERRFDRRAPGLVAPIVCPWPSPLRTPAAAGDADAPRLEMDAQGNVTARWPSGFDPAEEQVARYRAGEGWSPAGNERLAAAPAASAPAR